MQPARGTSGCIRVSALRQLLQVHALPPTIPQLTDKPQLRSLVLWIFSRRPFARDLVGGLVRGDEEGLKA